MRKNVSNQTMDEELKIFLGIEPKVEEQKPDPVPADTPAQEHEDAQAGTDENMNEQTGEAVQEKCGGTSAGTSAGSTPYQRQATPGIAGGIQGNVPACPDHWKPEARVP